MNVAIDTKKNLLAFSAGVDSTALFFLLLEQNIPFDLAIVNYNLRAQAKDEVTYAKQLAKKYSKNCFVKEVRLKASNVEHEARQVRYDFFEELMLEHNYESLLTAHQLNDKVEWLLMQLCKGAGLKELLGLEARVVKSTYQILRPLLEYSKEELQSYLDEKKIKYFFDESNNDEHFYRNAMRHNISNELIVNYKEGLQKSLSYLHNDLNSLNINYSPLYQNSEFELFKASKDDNINLRIIDQSLKNRGYLMSAKAKTHLLKNKEDVVSRKVAVSITQDHIWIAPACEVFMNKSFKERCRIKKVPKNIRAYLFEIKETKLFETICVEQTS